MRVLNGNFRKGGVSYCSSRQQIGRIFALRIRHRPFVSKKYSKLSHRLSSQNIVFFGPITLEQLSPRTLRGDGTRLLGWFRFLIKEELSTAFDGPEGQQSLSGAAVARHHKPGLVLPENSQLNLTNIAELQPATQKCILSVSANCVFQGDFCRPIVSPPN